MFLIFDELNGSMAGLGKSRGVSVGQYNCNVRTDSVAAALLGYY